MCEDDVPLVGLKRTNIIITPIPFFQSGNLRGQQLRLYDSQILLLPPGSVVQN